MNWTEIRQHLQFWTFIFLLPLLAGSLERWWT